MAALSVSATLIGGFAITISGRPLDPASFERPSGIRLLKLLLATPGNRVRREAAAELLWPESPDDRSAVNLRKAVHFARRALEAAGAPQLLRSGTDSLELDPAVALDVDLDSLRAAIDAARSLRPTMLGGDAGVVAMEQLVAFGAGDLLPDDTYEEWLLPLRERLRVQRVDALASAAAHARSIARPDLARQVIDLLLELEPADESAHRMAIELHLEDGRVDLARRQLLRCASALADLYGVEPAPELRRLIEAGFSRPAARTSNAPSAARRTSPNGDRSIGGAMVDALVEAVTALAGGRPLVVAIGNVGLEHPEVDWSRNLHR